MYRLEVVLSALCLSAVAFAGCVSTGDETGIPSLGETVDAPSPDPVALIVVLVDDVQVFPGAGAAEGDAGNESAVAADDGDDGANGTTGSGGDAANGTAGADANATSGPDGNVTDASAADLTLEPGLNITFDGSSSTGTNLTYVWTVGAANGTGDEVGNETNVTHAFEDAGEYVVTLAVSDDEGRTAESSLAITVALAGPAPGTHLRDAEEEFGGGQVVGGDPTCSSNTGLNEKSFEWVLVDEEEDGTPSIVTKIAITGSRGAAGLGQRLTLQDPAGETVGEGSSIEVEGEFGPGTYVITWRLCGGFSTSSNAVAIASYVTRAT